MPLPFNSPKVSNNNNTAYQPHPHSANKRPVKKTLQPTEKSSSSKSISRISKGTSNTMNKMRGGSSSGRLKSVGSSDRTTRAKSSERNSGLLSSQSENEDSDVVLLMTNMKSGSSGGGDSSDAPSSSGNSPGLISTSDDQTLNSRRSRSRIRTRRQRGKSLESALHRREEESSVSASASASASQSGSAATNTSRERRRRGNSAEAATIRKSKLEKIYELLDKNKELRGENRSLKKELAESEKRAFALQSALYDAARLRPKNEEEEGENDDQQKTQEKSSTSPNDCEGFRMKEAMRYLSKFSLSQGDEIRTLRSELESSKSLLRKKESKIEHLQAECDNFESSRHRYDQQARSDREEIESLKRELMETKQMVEVREEERNRAKSENRMMVLYREKSTRQMSVLQEEISALRKSKHRGFDDSVGSKGHNAEVETLVDSLRQELAEKIERIVLLEFERDVLRDEVTSLKDKKMMDETFPMKEGFDEMSADDHTTFTENDDLWG